MHFLVFPFPRGGFEYNLSGKSRALAASVARCTLIFIMMRKCHTLDDKFDRRCEVSLEREKGARLSIASAVIRSRTVALIHRFMCPVYYLGLARIKLSMAPHFFSFSRLFSRAPARWCGTWELRLLQLLNRHYTMRVHACMRTSMWM